MARIRTKLRGWTTEEEELLLKYRQEGLTYAQIGEKLGRSEEAVAKKAQRLQQRKARSSSVCRLWTDKEIKYLEEHYGKQSSQEIARALGRSRSAIYEKARDLGLVRGIVRASSAHDALFYDDIERKVAQLDVRPGDIVQVMAGKRRKRGTVLAVYPNHLLVQGERGYRESFSAVDIATGAVSIKVLRRIV